MKRYLRWLAVVGLVGLTACGGAGPSVTTVTLTEADSGKAISLAKGQPLVLRLAANATTGFAWQTATAPIAAVLTTVSSDYESSATPGLVGAGGTQVLKYQGAGAGQTPLRLIYVQPWAPTNVGQEFTLTITVN